MALARIVLKPGVDKQNTEYGAEGGWIDSDYVRHFWSPQFLRDCCGAFNLGNLRLPFYSAALPFVLFWRSIVLRQCQRWLRPLQR